MRIAHLTSVYLPAIGGAQVCVHNIASRHSSGGHQVSVVCPREHAAVKTGNYEKIALWTGAQKLISNLYPVGELYLQRQLAALQERYRFDVWQVTVGYPLGVAAVDFFNKKKIPCVLRCSGDDIQVMPEVYGMRLNPFVDAKVRENYPRFNAFIAISEEMRNNFEALGVLREKIHLIPNGVDVKRFSSATSKIELRAKWGFPSDKKIILTVGRNHTKKGFDLIPDMISRLKEAGKNDFIWILVGQGNSLIKALVKDQSVKDRIVVYEKIDSRSESFEFPSRELVELYSLSDMFVFPTWIETFGIVVIEAMAAGLPIVTTTALGVDELIDDGRTGYKTEPGNVEAMVGNIEKVLKSEEVRRSLSKSAREKSREYDWDNVAQQYLQLYREIVA